MAAMGINLRLSVVESVLAQSEALGLTPEQRRALELLSFDLRAEQVRLASERELLEIEARRAAAEASSPAAIALGQLRAIEAKAVELKAASLNALERIWAILSAQQQARLRGQLEAFALLEPTNDAPGAVDLDSRIKAALEQRLKDTKIVEIETAQAIADRVIGWAKTFALLVGVPLGLLGLVLGVLGVRSYNDFTTLVTKSRTDVAQLVEKGVRDASEIQAQAEKLRAQYAGLQKQFGEVSALAKDVETLTSKVERIEGKLTRSEELFGPSRLSLWQFAPDNLQRPAALVVLLPGCNQDAARFAIDSGWVEVASRRHFVLAVAAQPASEDNPRGCYRWWEREQIRKGQGDALSIMATVDHMLATPGLVDAGKVFIVGFSAGGATVAAMLATYPQIFAGGAIMGGLPYGCANNAMEALSCMSSSRNLAPSEWARLVREAADSDGHWPRVSIWHGLSDTTVAPDNARELMEQWTAVHGIDQKPDSETSDGTLSRQTFRNDGGEIMVELNLIAGMKDGVPVDADGGCGKSGQYTIDVDMCSSARIADFWGLADDGAKAPN